MFFIDKDTPSIKTMIRTVNNDKSMWFVHHKGNDGLKFIIFNHMKNRDAKLPITFFLIFKE